MRSLSRLGFDRAFLPLTDLHPVAWALQNRKRIAQLEASKRRPPRKIAVAASNTLWGLDLTLVWILGFFLVFGLIRAAFWGGRWGGPRHGPRGGHFEEWHRRAHESESDRAAG